MGLPAALHQRPDCTDHRAAKAAAGFDAGRVTAGFRLKAHGQAGLPIASQGAQGRQRLRIGAVTVQMWLVLRQCLWPFARALQRGFHRQLDAADVQRHAAGGELAAQLTEGFNAGDLNPVDRLRKQADMGKRPATPCPSWRGDCFQGEVFAAGVQLCGSSSLMRLLGQVGRRSITSLR